MTSNEIAKRTGLSKPTAREIIRRLEAAGLIRESGARPTRRGPDAALFEAVTENDLAVAIDLQYVDVRSTIVDARGATYPVAAGHMSESESQGDAVEIIETAMARASAAAGVDGDQITAACIGVQASVDHGSDTLSFSDGLTGWPRTDVTETLSKELGMSVTIENDANLAAVAERTEGAGAATDSFALVWLAEGLGLALDLHGQLYRGTSGAAGEIGYLALPAAALTLAPKASTLGDLVSESAVTALAIEQGVAGPDATWRTVLAQLPDLDPDHPFFDALAGRIGHASLASLAVTDPEVLILHGPTGISAGAPLAASTTRWLRTHTRWATTVIPPAVTDAPVLRGARRLLMDDLRKTLAARIESITSGDGATSTNVTSKL